MRLLSISQRRWWAALFCATVFLSSASAYAQTTVDEGADTLTTAESLKIYPPYDSDGRRQTEVKFGDVVTVAGSTFDTTVTGVRWIDLVSNLGARISVAIDYTYVPGPAGMLYFSGERP